MTRGEIWYCDLKEPVGSVQGYSRPCLIVQCNKGNRHSATVTVCPISTQEKNYQTTHVKIDCLRKVSWVECEQITTVDKSQLSRQIGKLDIYTMVKVNEKIKIHLGL